MNALVRTPANENQRIAALREYGILDTAPDERFDCITALAADLFDVPIALVSLIGSDRQWLKSGRGLTICGTAHSSAFCAQTILNEAPFIVEDAFEHPLFETNPPVFGTSEIRFYAGLPLLSHDGLPLGSFCIMDRKPRQLSRDDVARLGRLAAIAMDELELRRMRAQAASLATAQAADNQLKSRFLSSMSHEFRTPLNAILGFSQILEMNPGGRFGKSELEYIAAIKSAGETLLQLTDSILTMAQLEANAIPFEIETICAQTVIDEAFQLHAPAAALNRLTLTRRLGDTPPTFRADYAQVLRIIGNFVSNAFKFTPPHGLVTLGCACDGGQVTLYVQDSGCGIPARHQHEAFQSFNRLGREGSTVAGAGLGLAIARRLAQTMNGEIGFHSQEGAGSRFWVRFPAA
jgi:signal transduction histidine kinase